ncbi:histidine kinase [Ornatilinea apprima]|uniref:Histidine kinase n=1 Tax=Ornatilinea apprima TaxID=1134406 RepID=A0A0P6XR58_9CHLR|nr:ATP-binding cassette domain-containing protein [Ornatilinea apprima]KPL72094.1 histidine kinase [Ornatilinea apprima]
MQPLLSVDRLSKSFNTLPVIQNVSFDLYPGQVLGIAGTSGSGKTTLANLLSGIEVPNEGHMIFDGQRCAWPFIAQKLGIEVIHQIPQLVNDMDICGNIFMGNEISLPIWRGTRLILPQKRMDEIAAKLLADLGIQFPTMRLKVKNLTGEQRQMVAVARALVKPAKMVIVDDASALLTYPNQQKILNLIQQWQKKGVAVIFFSNHLDHLFAVTDEILVIRDSQKVAHFHTDETNREEVVAALVGTKDHQQITPFIWALDNYYRARERAEELKQNQILLERDLAAQDSLNKQLINQLNNQVIALDKSNQALQDAHRRLLKAREQDLKRLARELHDQSIQDLLSINHEIEVFDNTREVDLEVSDFLTEMRQNIRSIIEELRNTCGSLRPPTIDSLGVGAAIISFANDWEAKTGIHISVDIDPQLIRLPEATELSLYRIVQEVLRNVRKHSKATEVLIQLKHTSPRSILLTVSDNGVGLPKDFDLSMLAGKGHFGLLGISERVALLGGNLSFHNNLDGGLFLQAEIPHPRVSKAE